MMKTLNGIWLALGLVQMALVAGCNGGQLQSDHLLSAEEEVAGAARQSSDSAVQAQPVRISRAFFEKSVIGTVKLGNEAVQSDVAWADRVSQTDPTADHEGCAVYQNTDGVQLCFNVMSDVSSLGLNPRDTRVKGLCGGSFDNARFVRATHDDGTVTAVFEGDCAGQATTAELTLRQI